MNYAFIPARGGSKGLPRKNAKLFLGEPLVVRTIRIAKEAEIFNAIIVNTDDEEIAALATEAGASVVSREPSMGSDAAEVDPLIKWTINEYASSFPGLDDSLMCLLYCTSPLRTSADIVATLELVRSGGYDSSLTLCETNDYLWSKNENTFSPENYDPRARAARQLESWNQYKENKV